MVAGMVAVSCDKTPSNEEEVASGVNQYGDKPVSALVLVNTDSEETIQNIYDDQGRLLDCMVGDDMRFVAEYGETPIFHVYSYDDKAQPVETIRLNASMANDKISTLTCCRRNSESGEFEAVELLNYTYDIDGHPTELSIKALDSDYGTSEVKYQFVWNNGNIETLNQYRGETLQNTYAISYNENTNRSGIIPMVIMMEVNPFFLLGDFYLANYPVSIARVSGDSTERAISLAWNYDDEGFPSWMTYGDVRILFEY